MAVALAPAGVCRATFCDGLHVSLSLSVQLLSRDVGPPCSRFVLVQSSKDGRLSQTSHDAQRIHRRVYFYRLSNRGKMDGL